MKRPDGLQLAEVRLERTGMTKADIEERRLRRLEKRIAHLAALARLMAIRGGGYVDRKTARRVRELLNQENGRLWEMMHPEGEPEDQARK